MTRDEVLELIQFNAENPDEYIDVYQVLAERYDLTRQEAKMQTYFLFYL